MNPLKELRRRLTARAAAELGPHGVDVFGRKEADLGQRIQSAIASGAGAALFVFPPAIRRVKVNQRTVIIDRLELLFRCNVNPVLADAQGKIDADAMALELLGLFHHWEPGLDQVGKHVFMTDDPVADVAHPKVEIRDVRFWTRAQYELRG